MTATTICAALTTYFTSTASDQRAVRILNVR
jgi:hypothetical protein